MVMLVGVQSNQFPRALDIAQPFRERGIQVAIGGFHVSGTIAMLAERDASVCRAQDLGISLFAGEAEGRLGQVLRDAAGGRLESISSCRSSSVREVACRGWINIAGRR